MFRFHFRFPHTIHSFRAALRSTGLCVCHVTFHYMNLMVLISLAALPKLHYFSHKKKGWVDLKATSCATTLRHGKPWNLINHRFVRKILTKQGGHLRRDRHQGPRYSCLHRVCTRIKKGGRQDIYYVREKIHATQCNKVEFDRPIISWHVLSLCWREHEILRKVSYSAPFQRGAAFWADLERREQEEDPQQWNNCRMYPGISQHLPEHMYPHHIIAKINSRRK